MIVVDACWVIALSDPEDLHHERAQEIRSELGDEEAMMHPVTVAEYLVGHARQGTFEQGVKAVLSVYGVPDDPVDFELLQHWARLGGSAKPHLRLLDAAVLDTALRYEARGVATFDKALVKAARRRGLTALTLERFSALK